MAPSFRPVQSSRLNLVEFVSARQMARLNPDDTKAQVSEAVLFMQLCQKVGEGNHRNAGMVSEHEEMTVA